MGSHTPFPISQSVTHSPSLLLRSAHPDGIGVPYGAPPPLPLAYSSTRIGSLMPSSSSKGLLTRQSSSSKSLTRLRAMSSQAELRAEEFNKKSTERLEKELMFQLKAKKAAEERAAIARGEMSAVDEPGADPYGVEDDEEEYEEEPQFDEKAARSEAQVDVLCARRVGCAQLALHRHVQGLPVRRPRPLGHAQREGDPPRARPVEHPARRRQAQELINACDYDGDGEVDYKEFVDVLARDTVAPAAMGKRDMQSLAFGGDGRTTLRRLLAAQQGHGKKDKYKISCPMTTTARRRRRRGRARLVKPAAPPAGGVG